MASFSQGVSAQGTLVPACNLIGPLTACVVPNPNDTSGDMVINIEVARSGAPNLIDAQHNANFVYSFPSNSAGAFIRSYGNVVYNSFTNRTTQTLIVFPGTNTPEFNLQLNVTNNTSVPATFCECSKSVSVSRVAASSSYAPIACYGQTTTLTAVGQFSDIGQYNYTLLPSGPSNTTGVFPGLAGSEAGITYTVNVESAEGCSTTTSQTITQPAFNPVVLNCPESSSISACQSNEAITAAFNAWLNSFSFSGGTHANLTRSPQNPTLPALCGGSTEVTWTVTDDCGQPQSCTKTFTITPAPAVVVAQPANSTTPACSYADQAAANTAFAAWLAQFTVSGGCAPQGSYGTPAAPSFCGGTTSVTYTVTDRCYQTSTVTRTFTITAPPAVVVGQPANSTTPACSYADQAAANTAFAAWLAQFTVSGGCAPQGSFGTPSAPAFCGGTTSVTYTVTDKCYQTSTVTRTFTITAPPAVVVGQPANSTTSACIYADQAAADTAFAAWLAQFTVSGGCAPQGSFGTSSAPAFCGGTTSVTYTVTDKCYQTSTVTRTFTITAPAAVVVGQPANSTTSACIYADQAAANAAFAAWLAQFTVSGGCAPQGSFGTPSAPAFCGGSTTVTYTVTDRCYQTSTVTRTFTITAPAAVVVGQPANSTTSACIYASQEAANTAFAAWLAQFTVSGGCAPQGSFGTPSAPAFCGGSTTVTYTVTDRCYQTSTVTRTFTITAPAAVVVGQPANSTTPACSYADQAAANTAFAAWLAQFTVSGGCAPQGSFGTPSAPAFCGGTTSVTYTVTDKCYQTSTVTRTFTITAPPAVVVGQPANSTTSACIYVSQEAANAAFAAWLAQFTVSGGCAPQGSFGTPSAPAFCGGTTSVTYTVTDKCYQTSTVTRTFTITAPAAVVVGQPANSTTSACIYADQAAADTAFAAWLAQFTVSGGCAPQGSFGTPSAPAFCGGSTTVTYTVTDRCYQTSTVTRTFTITAPATVVVGHPADSTTPACSYADQAAANAAFTAWLAQFTVSGGCAPQGSFGTPSAPAFCGGSTTVTYTVTDRCYQTSTVTRTFTITAPATVVVGHRADSTTPACSYADQAAANAAFTAWLAQFTVSGGCAPQGSFGTPVAPPFCGGSTTVTYTVTDRCYQTTSVTGTFTITAPAAVVIGQPANSTTPSSSYANQAAADAAFAAWLAQFTVSGGCAPQGSYGTPVAPPYCGGSTTVTYTVTDRCYQTTSVTRTFTITGAAPVVVGQPANSTTPACSYADQAAANAAFAAWIAQFTVSGGIAPSGSFGDVTPTAPAFCGGTTTVIYTVTDQCYQTTSVTRTFTITAPTTVVVGQPANSSTSACIYADQAAANAAFTAWLAQFTVSGGCSPSGSFGADSGPNGPQAPAFCGGSVTVTYTVSDKCYQGSAVTRTFTITAPAAVVVNQPADSSTSACTYASQEAANAAFAAWLAQFTVSGGCAPQGSFGTPSAPAFCGGTTSVTYTVTDKCYQTSTVTRTFTITAPAAVVIGQPANSSTPACSYADQAAADAAFTAWLAQFSVSGGCAPQGSYGQVAAPAFCGGSTTVTYTVNDRCYQTSTVTRTFTITAASAVVVNKPADSNNAACSFANQAAADAAFASWLAQFTVSGGCAPQGSYGTPVAPPYCGGSTTVTYTVTDKCYQTTTLTRTFTIAAPAPVALSCPAATTIPGGQSQAAVDQAFAAWLALASANGGCNGVLTNNSQGTPSFCGGTATVTFTYTNACSAETTCQATFTVQPCGSIGDFVWNDLNHDGIQDAGEPGIPGVTVTLTGCSISMSTTTNANGYYIFNNLPACTYTVTFGSPSGYVASPANQGSNDAIDSDGGVVTVPLGVGENNMTIDSGFYQPNLEGCTLGYWKNHTNRWCGAYRTCDRFGDVFVNAPASLANLTLLQALNLGGGGIYNLARQGVAALLNTCSNDVDYAGYLDNTQAVINAINQAYATGGNAPGTLGSQLDTFNNSGCPLGGTSATTASNCPASAHRMSVSAYPNPTSGNFNIDLSNVNEGKISIVVYDMLGRLVDTQEIDPTNSLTIKLGSGYQTGIYNVIVTQGEEVKTVKVIKR